MRRALRVATSVLFVAVGSILVARAVFALPSLDGRPNHSASVAASSGILADKLRPWSQRYPNKTGVHALHEGAGAFATRMLLANAAERTIDAQYYIWHQDLTGLLLLRALREAANRGVHVRLLLDDNGIAGLDPILAQLDRHPRIEVRLYNPFTVRQVKPANYLFDFFRLNHRMHNKSFTVDGVATVVGGRNVGDEYFGTGPQPAYVDLDVLATGQVVEAVSEDFQRYWASASAYPLDLIVRHRAADASPLDIAYGRVAATPQHAEYKKIIGRTAVVRRLLAGDLPLEWTDVMLVSDDPVKTLGGARPDQLLVGRLADLMGEVRGKLDVISPYFVPGERGVSEFLALEERGVNVRILTNSMEATDVLLVHAGYAKYRGELLAGGVELFELKARSAPTARRSDTGTLGSSGSSLHAKTFAADQERIYIGSFNFDPRSVQLNTEMGFLIESADMATRMAESFDHGLTSVAYSLELDRGGNIRWRDRRPGLDDSLYASDPNTGAVKRAIVKALGWLPIQWML